MKWCLQKRSTDIEDKETNCKSYNNYSYHVMFGQQQYGENRRNLRMLQGIMAIPPLNSRKKNFIPSNYFGFKNILKENKKYTEHTIQPYNLAFIIDLD